MKTLRETLISELGMGISSDVSTTVVDRRNTADDSVKISTVDGRGVVAIPSKVDSASSELGCTYVFVGNISTEVESIFFEAGKASIELNIASVDVENASTEVEMKAGEDGAGDGVKILVERASSCEDIGMSLLLEDMCKTELESMVLSGTSIVDVGIKLLNGSSDSEVNWKLSSSSMLEAPCEGKSVGMTIFEEGSDGTADIVGFGEKPIVWKKSVLEDRRIPELVKEASNVANNCCLVNSESLEDIGIKGGCVDSEMLGDIENK